MGSAVRHPHRCNTYALRWRRWSLLGAVGALGLLACSLLPHLARARAVHSWTMGELARMADVLVVGEVLDVRASGKVAKDASTWWVPLLRMKAKVRVLRRFPEAKVVFRHGDTLTLVYPAIDWESIGGVGNGPMFPELHARDVFAFPLAKTLPEEKKGLTARDRVALKCVRRVIVPGSLGPGEWALVAEDGHQTLVPAARGRPPGEAPKTGEAFLRSEFAGCFARGSYRDICNGCGYLYRLFSLPEQEEDEVADKLDLIAGAVGDDPGRWFDVGAAAYFHLSWTPPVRLRSLLRNPDRHRAIDRLASMALGRVPRRGLEERLIKIAFEKAEVHVASSAERLRVDFWSHHLTLRLLGESLRENSPEAVYIASRIIGGRRHHIAPQAVRAAVHLVRQQGLVWPYLREACRLIHFLGDRKAFGVLLAEFRRARAGDRKRFEELWMCYPRYDKSERTVRVIGLILEDPQPLQNPLRYPEPVLVLQDAAGVHFGLKRNHTPEERAAALEKARKWLAVNAPGR